MLVEPSRSAQPRPAPPLPVVGLLTSAHADPDVEPDTEPDADLTTPGVVRRDHTTAISTFRLRNGAEVDLSGPLGAYAGMYPRGYLQGLRTAPTT